MLRAKSVSHSRSRGFTLVELLVVIGIIALLISILLPSLAKARESAARVKCGSNMHQIGIAFAMYLSDNKSTFPPLFYPGNPYGYNGYDPSTTNNASYATLLAKYLGGIHQDPYTPSNLAVFSCPNDTLLRQTWVNGGLLSYTMPMSYGTDTVYPHTVYGGGSSVTNPNAPGNIYYSNRGMGQIFDNQFSSQWIKTSMLKAPALTLLLVERSYTEQNQSTNWSLGYMVFGPSNLLYSGSAYQGFPMLHGTKGQEKRSVMNYLFTDDHVELLSPSQTVRDQNSLVPGNQYYAGDFMWTMNPYLFVN